MPPNGPMPVPSRPLGSCLLRRCSFLPGPQTSSGSTDDADRDRHYIRARSIAWRYAGEGSSVTFEGKGDAEMPSCPGETVWGPSADLRISVQSSFEISQALLTPAGIELKEHIHAMIVLILR
jgi:hypothetical protein